MFKKNKGFTLIELMVVIAIIAILATVVLVSLQSARDRATDTNRVSAVTQIRSYAEVYRSGSPRLDYFDLEEAEEVTKVTADANIYIFVDDEGSTDAERGQGYCAEAKLEGGGYFHVDSDLNAGNSESAVCDQDYADSL
jgi:prepilin-type N-terminal cleavage/methylation domain-containing protein